MTKTRKRDRPGRPKRLGRRYYQTIQKSLNGVLQWHTEKNLDAKAQDDYSAKQQVEPTKKTSPRDQCAAE